MKNENKIVRNALENNERTSNRFNLVSFLNCHFG